MTGDENLKKPNREMYVSNSASRRLHRLAEVRGCSMAGVVERLALEADDRYAGIFVSGNGIEKRALHRNGNQRGFFIGDGTGVGKA